MKFATRNIVKGLVLVSLVMSHLNTSAQSQGPRNSVTQTTIAGGTASWVNTGSVCLSDNTYATVTNGVSNIIRLSNFGFTLPANALIEGITLEVERKAEPVSPVGTGGGWVRFNNANFVSGTAAANYGSTTYSYNLPTSSATNNKRMLVVTIGIESVDNSAPSNPATNLTSVTYNGVAMTQLGITSLASATTANYSAVYYLLEAGLPATTGSRNLVISKTFPGEAGANAITPGEYVEMIGVNTFTNVDQVNAVTAVTQTSILPLITAPLIGNLRIGDYILSATMSNSPAVGGNFTSALGLTEAFESSFGNSGGPSTGGNFQVQYRSLAGLTGILSQIMATTGLGATRLAMVSFAVHAARVYDNAVTPDDASGLPTGNNLAVPANFANAWPDTDTYQTYGGSTNLWGATWTAADINDPDFGVSIQVNASGAIASIDHARLTVHYSIPLKMDWDLSDKDITSQTVGMNVYPNPASGSFFLESDEEINEVEMVDILGQSLSVYKTTLSKHKVQIENNYPKGTYVLIIKTASKVVSNSIVIN